MEKARGEKQVEEQNERERGQGPLQPGPRGANRFAGICH
jgi:hypothetical protein